MHNSHPSRCPDAKLASQIRACLIHLNHLNHLIHLIHLNHLNHNHLNHAPSLQVRREVPMPGLPAGASVVELLHGPELSRWLLVR